MNLFKYMQKPQELYDMHLVFNQVYGTQKTLNSAKRTYGHLIHAEDTLGRVFELVLTRYDRKVGPVENYVNRTLATIDKSRKKFEINTSENIDNKMENAQKSENGLTMVLPDTHHSGKEMILYDFDDDFYRSDDVLNCKKEAIDHFVRNFSYLYLGDKQIDKYFDTNLFENYDIDTILATQDLLMASYGEKVSEFIKLTHVEKLRPASADRYLTKRDTALEYQGTINGVWMLSRSAGSHKKLIYKLDLAKIRDYLKRTCFAKDSRGYLEIENKKYYLTLSGSIETDLGKALDMCEAEILNCIFSRTGLKVFVYNQQKEILFSTTKEYETEFVVKVLNKDMPLYFEEVPVKEF